MAHAPSSSSASHTIRYDKRRDGPEIYYVRGGSIFGKATKVAITHSTHVYSKRRRFPPPIWPTPIFCHQGGKMRGIGMTIVQNGGRPNGGQSPSFAVNVGRCSLYPQFPAKNNYAVSVCTAFWSHRMDPSANYCTSRSNYKTTFRTRVPANHLPR